MYTDIVDILTKQEKSPKGLSEELIEELREVFGSELTLVEAIDMIVESLQAKEHAAEKVETERPPKKAKELIFYDVKAVSKMLGCSIYTARQIMQRADFPCLDVGKSLRVSKEAFEKWAMEKRT